MNKRLRLSDLSSSFAERITKSYSMAKADPGHLGQFCIFSISQLNNFLRAYILSIRTGAYDSNGAVITFANNFTNEALLIDEVIRLGFRRRWRQGNAGNWAPHEEPAYHTPRVLLNIMTGLAPSNTSIFNTALIDSWKIDILRSIRNYFAHKSQSTEQEALRSVLTRYTIPTCRAKNALLQLDTTISSVLIDDIFAYLLDFSRQVT